MSPIAINGVDNQSIDVNGVQVKQALTSANDTVNKGVYDATTLHAVDANLAAANIKSGVTIFGVLGTYTNTLAQDILGTAIATFSGGSVNTFFDGMSKAKSMTAGADFTLETLTQTYDANSMAVAAGFLLGTCDDATGTSLKLQLYMDGVLMAESGYLSISDSDIMRGVIATKALSGSKTCYISVHNYAAVTRKLYNLFGNGASLGVGSIKLV